MHVYLTHTLLFKFIEKVINTLITLDYCEYIRQVFLVWVNSDGNLGSTEMYYLDYSTMLFTLQERITHNYNVNVSILSIA